MDRSIALGLALVVALAATPALAAVEDEPRFEAYTPEPRLEPGETQTVTIELVNDAEDPEDRVPPATAVRVEPRAGNTPFEIRSGTRSIGRMEDGEIREVDVRLTVPDDAPGGRYRLPLRVTYEYDGDEREGHTVRPILEVPRRPIFAVDGSAAGLRVGESGTVSLAVENVGSRVANRTAVEVTSANPGVAFGGSDAATAALGRLGPGDSADVSIEATATADASAREYPLQVRPTYRDHNGLDRSATARTVRVAVGARQTFSVSPRSLDLYGTTGRLVVTVENTGPAATADTGASLSSTDETVNIRSAAADLGPLSIGETVNATFGLQVARDAAPGPHRFELALLYDRGDETYRSRSIDFEATVPADRNRFAVQTINGTLEPDASNAVDVRLRNRGDATLTDVRARLGIGLPYESDKPTAFAGTLAPGEWADLTFEVTAPEDAVSGTDALPVNVTAEAPDGRTFVEGGLQATVTYPQETAAEQGILVLVVGAVVVFLVLLSGVWWLRH